MGPLTLCGFVVIQSRKAALTEDLLNQLPMRPYLPPDGTMIDVLSANEGVILYSLRKTASSRSWAGTELTLEPELLDICVDISYNNRDLFDTVRYLVSVCLPNTDQPRLQIFFIKG